MKNTRGRSLGSDAVQDGKFLAGLLNSPDGSWGYSSEAHQRVRTLVEQIAALREKSLAGVPPSDEELNSVNDALKHYPWVLRIHYPKIMRGGRISRSMTPRFIDWQAAAPEEAQTFVVMLVNLAHAGLIDRLRRCGRCSAWFFAARNPKARWCSMKCRQKVYRSAPGYKEKNAAYQRDHDRRIREMLNRIKGNKSAKKR